MDALVTERNLFLIRHGETDWNATKRLQGRSDIPLNDRGREQAWRHGEKLAGLVDQPERWHFVASPLQRTQETMAIIRGCMGLVRDEFATSEDIVELNYGAWEGKSWNQLAGETPELIKTRFRNPWDTVAPGGGESHAEMQARVVAWYEALPPLTVAVTHTGPTRIIRGHIAKLEPDRIAVLESRQDKFLSVTPAGFNWV